MSTDLYPGVTPPKDRPTCALLQVSTCRMPGVECRLWWAEFPRRIRATRLVEGTMIDRRGFLSSIAGVAGAARGFRWLQRYGKDGAERSGRLSDLGYGASNEFRDPLAEFAGCTRDELALLRNATEANSYIANGLDLKPGDEVLMTDQEHPGGEHPWNLRAKRYGIVVKKITLPKPVPNAAAVLNLINDGITPRTRVLFFSHITTVTGVVLPAKELCALARSKGILSAVDGAHVVGMMRLDLHELGCDMYTSSPHKWLQAPKGSGFLYVRDEVIDRLWNTIVTAGWDEPKLRAERFQRIGSSNLPALWGMRAAVQLANQIGMERIERRHRQMADYILKEMVQRGAESWTSPDPALRCAIASVNVAPIQITEIENWMWKTKKIRIRGGAPSKIRLSTPYYLLRKDVERYLAAFDEYRQTRNSA